MKGASGFIESKARRMKLTNFTDFGLRALMRIASSPDQVHSTADISREFDISRNHLTKIVAMLAAAGYLETRRGTGGGAQLAKSADQIRLGDIIRLLERGTPMVECFAPAGGLCVITPQCKLKGMLAEAEREFIDKMNRFTLADCALPPLAAT